MNFKAVFIWFFSIFLLNINVSNAYKDIKIEGLNRLSKETITTNLIYKEKISVSNSELSEELKNLYATGFFNSVELNLENGILTVKIIEVPLISAIKFNGLKEFKKDIIEKELSTKERTFYSKSLVIADAKKIEMIYKTLGILDVSVEPMIEFLEGGKVFVIFNIHETKQRTIRNIFIEGNNKISDRKIKEILPFKEDFILRFFSSNKGYNISETVNGIEKLKRYYKEQGYAKMEINHKVVSLEGKNKVDISIFLNEGKKYEFGNAKIINNIPTLDALREEEQKIISFKKGKTYNVVEIDKTRININNILQKYGFLSAEIKIDEEFDEVQNLVNIIFTINPAKRIYVGKINFFGNLKTNDNVIRREFTLGEGDVYSVEKIRRSIQKIRNLGYFSDVQIKEEQVAEDKINIMLFLQETSTLSTEFSLGYDFGSDISAMISLNETNFQGKGLGLGINFEKGRYDGSVQLSFTEPYLMEKDLAFITSLGYSIQDNKKLTSYKSESVFLNLRGIYTVSEYSRHSLSYGIKKDLLNVINIERFALNNPIILEQEGSFITSSIGQSLSFDKRDFSFLPSEGFMISGSQQVAGIGGNIYFIQHEVSGEQYFPLFGVSGSVLGFKLKFAYITGLKGEMVNIKDRYNLGARNGLRGFDFSGVGPKYRFTSPLTGETSDFNYGGKNLMVGNIEYRFPNFIPEEFGFTTFLFYDYGVVYGAEKSKVPLNNAVILDSRKLRSAAGAGISWRSPIGIIGFSYAHPLNKEEYDETRRFNISIGGMVL